MYDSDDLFHLSASFCNEITDDDEDEEEAATATVEADFTDAEPGHAVVGLVVVDLIFVTDGTALTAADAGVWQLLFADVTFARMPVLTSDCLLLKLLMFLKVLPPLLLMPVR